MRKVILLWLMILISLISSAYPVLAQENVIANIQAPVAAGQSEDYRLGPGDTLNIKVWGIEEFEPALIVRPDGKISLPLVGEIMVQGKTVAELTETISVALSTYIKNPMVNINIVQYRTVRIYVLGEVANPGMHEITKSHNLLDAIGAAGGYTKFADKDEVYVISKNTGKYQRVNLKNLLKKGDLTQNYELYEGDLVYLTRNGLSFVNDILPYISAIYQIKIITK